MLAENSEERVVPRNIEQPLSSDRIKALAARSADGGPPNLAIKKSVAT
jgi:hypothetical protein